MTKETIKNAFGAITNKMPKYAKPIETEIRKRGRPLKYSRDRYAEVLKLRLKGYSLGQIARETMISRATVYRMLERLGIS